MRLTIFYRTFVTTRKVTHAQLGQRLTRRRGTKHREPSIEIAIDTVLDHRRAADVLPFPPTFVATYGRRLVRDVRRIDDGRAPLPKDGNRVAQDLAMPRFVDEVRARHADARAGKPTAIQKACVVAV